MDERATGVDRPSETSLTSSPLAIAAFSLISYETAEHLGFYSRGIARASERASKKSDRYLNLRPPRMMRGIPTFVLKK